MHNTRRTARNGTLALALTLTLSMLVMAPATVSAGTSAGHLYLDTGTRQNELTIKPARTSSLGDAVLASLLLAAALASLAWLKSQQTRSARGRR